MMGDRQGRTCPNCGNHFDSQDSQDPNSRNKAEIILKDVRQEMDTTIRTYDCLLCLCRFVLYDEKGAAHTQVGGIYKKRAGKSL